MRQAKIVVELPCFNDLARFGKREEHVFVQAFVTQAAVEDSTQAFCIVICRPFSPILLRLQVEQLLQTFPTGIFGPHITKWRRLGMT
jgi:hypothetical protein